MKKSTIIVLLLILSGCASKEVFREYLDGATGFNEREWRQRSVFTKANTFYVTYKEDKNIYALGVTNYFDVAKVEEVTKKIDYVLESKMLDKAEIQIVYQPVAGFDGLVFLSGENRRFLRGWSDQEKEVTQIIPFYNSEISDGSSDEKIASFILSGDVLNLLRKSDNNIGIRLGVPSEKPNLAIEKLTEYFSTQEKVVWAKLGLVELVKSEGAPEFIYAVAFHSDGDRNPVTQEVVSILNASSGGRRPIAIVPPSDMFLTREALVFYKR